uniref:Uncharacterized protein n=1 Tax=Dulem virus 42 TaxID=3145760 RepID=A0AAU8BB32_9CAUD
MAKEQPLTIPFVIKNDWAKEAGMKPCGAANGYVAVSPDHILHGYHYDEINDFDIHGGLTFAASAEDCCYGIEQREDCLLLRDGDSIPPKSYWVFGFDTFHYDDDEFDWNIDAVINETFELERQLLDCWI